ncbi:ATP-binding protein [Catellatospora tritici]|uniref:ATP-binding protein n=1 Tax=Catellatospora tritici TaxID=2851566 RepID=UPI001C2CF1D0|nr:ATP-binding protein [Catellatospora tritici]MBV1853165.1 ATP-binding protein [Catellatospora tritici]
MNAAAIRLPGGAGSATMARHFVRTQLSAWALPDPGGDVLILTSELVGNAVQHGGGAVAIRLVRTDAGVRIEVTDRDPRPPVPRPAGIDGGFGLGLIQRLSADWGVVPGRTGKVVWLEYRLS